MRKAAKQIIACAALLAVLCILGRFAVFNRFTLYIPLADGAGEETAEVIVDRPEVLRTGEPEIRDGYMLIPVYPLRPGEAEVRISSREGRLWPLRVDRFLTVYNESNKNFTGDSGLLICVTLFWLLVSAIMMRYFLRAKGSAFYDYSTIYYAGFSLFALVSGVTMLRTAAAHIAYPEEYNMFAAFQTISGAGTGAMILTSPLMLLFAGVMAAGNIALLRHERLRPQNLLGLLISLLLVGGEAVGIYLYSQNLAGAEWEIMLHDTVQNTYAAAFIYCQCMLTGAVICGLWAAKHRPAADKDFIIIPGCWFRADGSLPPLLRGRADKALEFWHRQKDETGTEAVFIPSGGQGSNEPMPEAEAIRQYLISKGIEDRLILPEDRSRNTYENMANSGRIIRETKPDGKTVFSTSSYHVFRSGLWAVRAGLPAEGIGSRTKWWFWPNAFMRETAGLMQKRWKQELLFLVLTAVFFGILSVLLF